MGDINYDGFDLDCHRRRYVGWVAADEECSTGNLTQYLLDVVLKLNRETDLGLLFINEFFGDNQLVQGGL